MTEAAASSASRIASVDVVGRARSVDAQQQASLLVVGDERLGLVVVDPEPRPDRLGVVVLAALVAAADADRRDLVGDVDQHDGGELARVGLQRRGERIGLADGAREAVEHDRLVGGPGDRLADHVDDQRVRHELAAGHVLRGAAAELAPVGAGAAQEVAGDQCDEALLVAQAGGLRALAAAGRSEQHDGGGWHGGR